MAVGDLVKQVNKSWTAHSVSRPFHPLILVAYILLSLWPAWSLVMIQSYSTFPVQYKTAHALQCWWQIVNQRGRAPVDHSDPSLHCSLYHATRKTNNNAICMQIGSSCFHVTLHQSFYQTNRYQEDEWQKVEYVSVWGRTGQVCGLMHYSSLLLNILRPLIWLFWILERR